MLSFAVLDVSRHDIKGQKFGHNSLLFYANFSG